MLTSCCTINLTLHIGSDITPEFRLPCGKDTTLHFELLFHVYYNKWQSKLIFVLEKRLNKILIILNLPSPIIFIQRNKSPGVRKDIINSS